METNSIAIKTRYFGMSSSDRCALIAATDVTGLPTSHVFVAERTPGTPPGACRT